ncbi:MAG: tRNA (adenosine(37)-N6)-dimethylallyltransferase MiaA [Malacoplasma sp.]|nr:tRNA (adenosine(37)-N6)-dimethylallyltransferase MiaA [Malacoplasma sp.]
MKKLLIVVGATGSNKSNLSKKLAKHFNTEIFVADAFQVYKEISAGINKPSEIELKEIKHHFVNHISIYDEWNVKRFQTEFKNITLDSNKDIFVVEGGSNLYIDSIIKNYNFKPLVDLSYDWDQQSNNDLWNELNKIDENEAKKIPKENRRRLLQAIKIIYSNNEKKSILDTKNNPVLFDIFMIWKKIPRDNLYKILDDRTQKMYQEIGWLKEVENLINQDENVINLNSFKAIGYPEMSQAIINKNEPDLNLIKRKVRNYAKRQETWIRNKFKIDFVYNNDDDWNNLVAQCKKFINK